MKVVQKVFEQILDIGITLSQWDLLLLLPELHTKVAEVTICQHITRRDMQAVLENRHAGSTREHTRSNTPALDRSSHASGILQSYIPNVTIPYIDNVLIHRPADRYILLDGTKEWIPDNPGIHHFVWEHLQGLNHIVQRTKYCSGTYSGPKTVLCVEEITIVGHRCTPCGCLPDPSHIDKIANWGPCKDLSEVHMFLGTIGVCRNFILNFAK